MRTRIAHMIDHTLLKPEATRAQVTALIEEATRLGVYSVCVSPSQLPITTPDSLLVATVVGFPSGAVKPAIKAAEAAQAVADGADEIDMVIDISRAVAGDTGYTEDEIRQVRHACPNAVVKVIIESAALSDEAIVACCRAAENAGADFVKTSTGFHPAVVASVRVAYEDILAHADDANPPRLPAFEEPDQGALAASYHGEPAAKDTWVLAQSLRALIELWHATEAERRKRKYLRAALGEEVRPFPYAKNR